MADSEKKLDPDATSSENDRRVSEPGNVLKLELDLDGNPASARKAIDQQVADLENILQDLVSRQSDTDQQLQQLHGKTGKLEGNFDTHLDLTRLKLQSVLEKYTALKTDAEYLGKQSAQLEQSLVSARSETESLIKTLGDSTQQQIAEANQATRELLQKEAELAQQRQAQLVQQLYATEDRLSDVEAKASQLGSDLESRARVLEGTIEAVQSRLQQEMQRIEEEARQCDEELKKEAARLREAGAMQARRVVQHEARTGRLERRAEANEARTTDLESRAGDLEERASLGEGRSEALEQRAEQLEYRAGTLEQDSAKLAQQHDQLSSRADVLETTTEQQGSQLGRLAEGLRRQLRGFSGMLLLLVVALVAVGMYLHNQDQKLEAQNEVQNAENAQMTESLQASQSNLEGELAVHKSALETQSVTLNAADSGLKTGITENQRLLQQQQQAVEALNRRVMTLQDKADSANGRLAALHPLGNYGADSIIHGSSWFAQQDASYSLVRLTRSDDKQSLYAVADDWAYYLEGRYLAQFETEHDGKRAYELYYGPFSSADEADSFIRRMPTLDRGVPLQVVAVSDVQSQIAGGVSN